MNRQHDTAWSRRRAGVRAEAEAENREAKQQARADEQARFEGKCDADILQELQLKDPDQMKAGDDFSAFMRDQVPERLRQRALRVMWRTNPVLACVDDLVDYGDDFKAEWTGAVIKTAYRVGKGMLSHVEEMEKQQLAEDQAGETPDLAEEDTKLDDETLADAGAISIEQEISDPVHTLVAESELAEEPTEFRPARRMRFEFDGAV